MCDHGHGHGRGCASESVQVDDSEQQYDMYAHINKDKFTALNEEKEGTAIEVFKKWSDRMDNDVDDELLFNIPFTGHVKLTGITLIGEEGQMHPARVRIFKDRENMSFDDAQAGKPDQEFELKIDTEAKVDYPLPSIRFSNVYHLSLHFPKSFGAEQSRIYYIGIRGTFQHDFREKIAIATYEARPMPDDHKAEVPDQSVGFTAGQSDPLNGPQLKLKGPLVDSNSPFKICGVTNRFVNLTSVNVHDLECALMTAINVLEAMLRRNTVRVNDHPKLGIPVLPEHPKIWKMVRRIENDVHVFGVLADIIDEGEPATQEEEQTLADFKGVLVRLVKDLATIFPHDDEEPRL